MRHAFLQDARATYERGLDWSGLGGDSLAFALSQAQSGRSWLVVTDEPDAAEKLAVALEFFRREGQHVMLFPADDSKPYDGFSPSWRRGAQRASAMAAVAERKAVIVVAPARALLQRVPDVSIQRASTIHLSVGQILDRDVLVRQLLSHGYL